MKSDRLSFLGTHLKGLLESRLLVACHDLFLCHVRELVDAFSMRDVILRVVVFNGGQVCCKDFESDIEVAFRCIGAAIPSNELHELCADQRFFQVPAFLLFECLLESMLDLTDLDWSHNWCFTDGFELTDLGLLEEGFCQILFLLLGHHRSSTDGHEFRHLGLLEQGLCSFSAFQIDMSDFIRHFIDRNKLSQLWIEVARDQKLRPCYRLETLKQLLQHFNNYN